MINVPGKNTALSYDRPVRRAPSSLRTSGPTELLPQLVGFFCPDVGGCREGTARMRPTKNRYKMRFLRRENSPAGSQPDGLPQAI